MNSRPSSATRPNIVLFLVDDMGWQDTSEPFWSEETPFNRRYHTPNMERLARSGMKFTQAYACAVCSPTRVSLLTGQNAARHRVTNWTLQKNKAQDAPSKVLEYPAWNVNGISQEPGVDRAVQAKCLPSYLQEAGYRTIHVGKAHFGAVGTPGADPLNLGFDLNIAGHAAGGPGSYLSEQGFSAQWRDGDEVWDVPGLEKYHDSGVFLTEALTREANEAMQAAVDDSQPFFLYMSHYAVHVPFAEDPRFIGKYRDEGLPPQEAMYAALIEGMDKSLGDILDRLEQLGVDDNTVVLFMSDNGGLSAHGRDGEPHTHNQPLSSGKGSVHEGGIREPMLVRWPGVTTADSVCHDYLIIEDFFPSLLEIAGVQDGYTSDGHSFVPLLHGGDTDPDRPLFWHYPNNWGPAGPGIGSYSAIRQGDWKLIYYHEPDRTQRYELFNIATDIGETNNRVATEPEIVARLSNRLRLFLLEVEAQMPTDRATGHTVPLPGDAST
jgi:arylsulfatase A-like enzyme